MTKIELFFLTNFSHLIQHEDINIMSAREDRYNELLKYYNTLFQNNECGCFNSEDDIVNELTKQMEANGKWILG